MTDTKTLIIRLSSDASAPTTPMSPRYWAMRLIVVLILYAFVTQYVLGIRPDLTIQFSRSLFALEIALLIVLLFSSIVASVLSMYPDAYQKPKLLILPYITFFLLAVLMALQLLQPPDVLMVMSRPGAHTIECALCIGAVALIPSALLFALLRKGASIRQFQAGSFAVLAASAIGCLTLRVAEEIDSIMHLVSWHYVPTLIFAVFGAAVGKWLLKW